METDEELMRLSYIELALRIERGAAVEAIDTITDEFNAFIVRAMRFIRLHEQDGAT